MSGIPWSRRVTMSPCGAAERLAMRFTVVELRRELRARGKLGSGRKGDLIRRLLSEVGRVDNKTLEKVENRALRSKRQVTLRTILDPEVAISWLRAE